MSRKITPSTSLDTLKKEAKRWLKQLRADEASARARFALAYPGVRSQPGLRDVQHALAREFDYENWIALKHALETQPAPSSPEIAAISELAARFLEFACPDHHVRSLPAHQMAQSAAMRLLEQHPEIARESLFTAVVCGEVEQVRRILGERPELANERRLAIGPDRSGVGGNYDFLTDLGTKPWEPLLYLSFTRLSLARANDAAVEIARVLLDHGADPNAYFMAGASRYTALTGVVGEGEEGRPPHPRRDDLARLLLERGAEPYDGQVIYNIHFRGQVLWWMKLMYEFSIQRGRRDDWDEPEWHMLDQGNYGTGACWHLSIAVQNDDVELAEWCLAHGATPNAAPPADTRFPQYSLYEMAIRLGHTAVAETLLRYGAERREVSLDNEARFVAACLRLDHDDVKRLLAQHPELLRSPKAFFAAAERDRDEVVALLLDLGTPIEIEDEKKQRPLHVAAANNAVRVAQLLLARGAEVDPRELNWDNTPLDFAVYYDLRAMIDLLAPHSRDVWNLTRIGAVERLREILPADPQLAKLTWHTTPLFWLPDDEEKALAIATLFLEHGADAQFTSERDGSTAADVARRRGMQTVAALLGARSPGTWSAGPSPLDDARGDPELVEGSGPGIGTEQLNELANDLVRAHDSHDETALQRLNQHYERSFTFEDLWAEIWRRVYAFRQRSSRVVKNYLQLSEAQTIVAQDAGFQSWSALTEAATTGARRPVNAFDIDMQENSIAPRRKLNDREWDDLIAVMKERGITSLNANGLMTDAVIAKVAAVDHVTALSLGGSRGLSDKGLLQLARMPQLLRLDLSEYPGGKLTDRGLEVLRDLPHLQRFEMTWQRGISDAGAANLRFCEELEGVNLMGSPTGDGAIEALQGKSKLRAFNSGRLVTDRGLSLLHNFPWLATWHEPEGARLLIDGPFTNRGLAKLAGLEGVFDLDLFWHVTGLTSDGLASLKQLPHLGSLGCDGKLSDDAGMRHIAAIPRLKRLRAQEAVATDEGFVALSKSATLESIWGRECPNFSSRGFVALSKMPALRGFAIGCANVSDEALSTLPDFPALCELTPIGVKDPGFRHVGRCARLERLTCMYCRDTTDLATEAIAGLQLKYYYAGLTKITDRSLEILGKMSSLEQIEFYECNGITDAGLPFLAALPNLREVHLDSLPGVSLEGTRVFPTRVRVKYST